MPVFSVFQPFLFSVCVFMKLVHVNEWKEKRDFNKTNIIFFNIN